MFFRWWAMRDGFRHSTPPRFLLFLMRLCISDRKVYVDANINVTPPPPPPSKSGDGWENYIACGLTNENYILSFSTPLSFPFPSISHCPCPAASLTHWAPQQMAHKCSLGQQTLQSMEERSNQRTKLLTSIVHLVSREVCAHSPHDLILK